MKHLNTFFTVFLLAASFVAGGVFFSQYADSFVLSNDLFPQTDSVELSEVQEVYNFLEESYYDPEKFKENTTFETGAVKGLVNSLDDPYTVYYTADEFKEFQSNLEGEFEGIGAQIGIRDGQLIVVTPLEGTPAKKAGLQPQDKILAIDTEPTQGLTVEEAVAVIRGEKGTEVVLLIEKPETQEVVEVPIIRGVIDVPNVRAEVEDGVGVLAWGQFESNTADEVALELQKFADQGINDVVIDLRFNGGGYLNGAVDIVDLFVEAGEVVVSEQGRDGIMSESKSKREARFGDMNLVVLVNGGSASAAEITAAALRDIKDVPLVGETTFGKGVVQRVQEFGTDAAIKYTVAEWLTPAGDKIHEVGIKPDVEVELEAPKEGTKPEDAKDTQLERAKKVLKKISKKKS